jgi:hypothetical protein
VSAPCSSNATSPHSYGTHSQGAAYLPSGIKKQKYDDDILFHHRQGLQPVEIAAALVAAHKLDPKQFNRKTVNGCLTYLCKKGEKMQPVNIDSQLSAMNVPSTCFLFSLFDSF